MVKTDLEQLSESLLGIYHWCKTKGISQSIYNQLKITQDKVYGELKTLSPGLSEKEINKKITEMIKEGISNKEILDQFKNSSYKIAGIRSALTKRRDFYLKFGDKSETFKSHKKAFIGLILYLCKKYGKIAMRKHLDNSGNYSYPQLLLKGEPLEEVKKCYTSTKFGYLYSHCSSRALRKRMVYVIKEFKENVEFTGSDTIRKKWDANFPKNTDLIIPTLKALKDLKGSGTIEEINNKVYENENFSDEVLQEPHGEDGSQNEVDYRLAWARTILKKHKLIENSARGVWSLINLSVKINSNEINKMIKNRGEITYE